VSMFKTLKSLPPQKILAGIAIALIVFDLFVKPLIAVSLGLLAIAFLALSPWLQRLPNFLKTAELPGGFKFEFRESLEEAEREAGDAGLLAEPQEEQRKLPIYELEQFWIEITHNLRD
jgi:hypothetical protein